MKETGTEPNAPLARTPDWGSADYEILCELSTGPLGKIRLATIVRGRDAGRLVRLRSVPHAMAAVLARSVEIGARVAHARLLKVLGLAVVDGELNVASEFVEGATLWELQKAAILQQHPVGQAVALRIVSDLLYASVAARRAFRQASGVALGRCLWPDTAWVAAFGEALLTEPGVGATLAVVSEAAEAYLSPEETHGDAGGPASDVFAAGVLLWELLANTSLFGRGEPARTLERVRFEPVPRLVTSGLFADPIPNEVTDIIERALAREPADRYAGPEEMVAQIALLPKHFVASDRDVQMALEELVHIDQQRRTSGSFLPASGDHEVLWDIPTRPLRTPLVAAAEERVTLRPAELHALISGAFPLDERQSVEAAAPALAPEPLVPAVPMRSRRVRAIVLTAAAVVLSAAAAYAATRSPKLGAAPPASSELRAAVSAATRASLALPAVPTQASPARSPLSASSPNSARPSGHEATKPARPRDYRPRSIAPYRPKGI